MKSIPLTTKSSQEPINLVFNVSLSEIKRQFTWGHWIEGKNRIEGTTIFLDQISDVDNNLLAFAGNSNYTVFYVTPYMILVPFSRDHFRIWSNQVDNNYYGSATYDEGFRVGKFHVTQEPENVQQLLEKTVEQSFTQEELLFNLNRIPVGHLVTDFGHARLAVDLQWKRRSYTFQRTKPMWLTPTDISLLWSGLTWVGEG